MEHFIMCESKDDFMKMTDVTEVTVSKKACFEKGDILYFSFAHLMACFDVISVLPNCVNDNLVHLVLVPVLVESEVKNSVAHN